MSKDPEPYSPERLRDLLHRGSLAAHRYRAFLARQLGHLLFLTSGGVTALTHRLERAGHIVRESHPRDRRSFVLQATPAILQRGDDLSEPLAQALDAISARRSPEERELIGRYLEDVLEAMATHATEEPGDRDHEEPSLPARVHPGLWA